MFEPDEYIFSKFANYFKKRKRSKYESLSYVVKLEDLSSKLTILARAITGNPIQIFEAEREGGYKDFSFFLPKYFSVFKNRNDNRDFYFFRTLYLCIQFQLQLNWKDNNEYTLKESQEEAKLNSQIVLDELFHQFRTTKEIYDKLNNYFNSELEKNKEIDWSFVYGKYMVNSSQENLPLLNKKLNQQKKIKTNKAKTILKSNAVEEIKSLQIDKKQQEDATTQHQFEKIETADEFGGNWRDFDGEDELEDHQNALDELTMKYTVRVNEETHSIYQADFVENTSVAESANLENQQEYIPYNEWNYKTRTYKENFCKVFPKHVVKTDANFYRNTLNSYRSTLLELRKLLNTVNNKYQLQKRQPQGEDFDIDALTDLFVDVKSAHTPSEKIYLSKRKREKDLAILLLLDTSLSTDGYAAGNKVIDVEKQVSILFGEILAEFNIQFSIASFFSNTRNHASYITIKDFNENWDSAKYKIGTVEPSGYTRIGVALRHAGTVLDKQESKNKWVILISDGKPNDYDKYEGKYGIKDVKQALRELYERQINSYALAIEAQAKFYLPEMFGQNHYQILTSPNELIRSLVLLYDKIKRK